METGGEPTGRSRHGLRVTSLVVGGGLVVVGVCLALMMSHGATAREVALNARALHWTTSALGAGAVARAGNAQAVVFAVDHEIGVASTDAFDTALAEAHRTLDAFRQVVGSQPTTSDSRLDHVMAEFTVVAVEVLALIESGEVGAAVALSQGGFEETYQRMAEGLVSEQERLLELMAETEGAVGRTAAAARVLVTLLIPATVLVAYFLLARRQMRERRIVMEGELQAALALSQAKDEFIAGLSHELRTPLTSIYGFSEVLLESGLVDPNHSMELIGLINHESADLSRMVEDLLTAARLEAGALSIDISDVELAAEVEAVLHPFRRIGVSLSVVCPPLVVRADRLRLRQVLRNLVSNADRHGGPDIRLEARETHEGVVFAVIDNGDGVPPDIEDRLFQRFVHEGRQTLLAGSVGLGLAIARSLVEGMGGTIRYFRVDDNTVFSVTLPRGESPPPDIYIEINGVGDEPSEAGLMTAIGER